jgi:hypothetical protein
LFAISAYPPPFFISNVEFEHPASTTSANDSLSTPRATDEHHDFFLAPLHPTNELLPEFQFLNDSALPPAPPASVRCWTEYVPDFHRSKGPFTFTTWGRAIQAFPAPTSAWSDFQLDVSPYDGTYTDFFDFTTALDARESVAALPRLTAEAVSAHMMSELDGQHSLTADTSPDYPSHPSASAFGFPSVNMSGGKRDLVVND